MSARKDKQKIYKEYVTTDISIRSLADKHSLSQSTLNRWIKEGGWTEQKRGFLERAAIRAKERLKADEERYVEALADRWEKMYCTGDKLLEKVEEMLSLEGDALAPRDLKSLSSILVDLMTLHNVGESKTESSGDSYEIRITQEVGNASD